MDDGAIFQLGMISLRIEGGTQRYAGPLWAMGFILWGRYRMIQNPFPRAGFKLKVVYYRQSLVF